MLLSIKNLKPYLPLSFMSILALSLLGFRILYFTPISPEPFLDQIQNGNFHFLFLAWNLLLAWVPLIISHWLSKKQYSLKIVGVCIFCWLLFFPNAPYLLTDFVHLRTQAGIPLFYDILLFFTFAILGLSLGVLSLEQVRKYLSFYWNQRFANLFVVATLLLSGLGIYLGRVLRWNSWDAIIQPWGPLKDTFYLLTNPIENWQAWFMMICFSLSLSTYYWVIRSWST